MADVLRSCSKTACRWPAAASLSYRYATKQVWLVDLTSTPDPSLYDLCPHHADALVVPRGWERVDHRTEPQIMVEPSADDRAVEAARRLAADDPDPTPRRPLVTAGAGRNRYAALVEQLPRLAAEASGTGPATIRSGPARAEVEEPAPAPVSLRGRAEAAHPSSQSRPTPAHPAARSRPAHVQPMPSRELAPLPPQAGGWSPPEERPLPGQLAIPVDEDGDDAVVVPFSSASPRRRR